MNNFLTAEEFAQATGGTWLEQPSQPITGVAIDTREDLAGKMFLALRGEKSDGHAYLEAAHKARAVAVMIEKRECQCPGVARLLVPNVQSALTAAAAAWRNILRCQCVAITGSAGKTTTRRLISAALAAFGKTHASPKSFNNHLGVPLSILGAPRDTKFLVLEIGMNHPGEIEPLAKLARPVVAMIVNSGSAHLGGLGSRQAIALEKSSIARGLETSGIFVIHGDSPELIDIAFKQPRPAGGLLILFGEGGRCLWKLFSREVVSDGPQKVVAQGPAYGGGCKISFTLKLPGLHNAINAIGAIAAVTALGLDAQTAANAMAEVEPSQGRMVRERIGEIDIYNDSYNANPEAMLASIAAFAEVAVTAKRRIVALGDMHELGEQSQALHRMVGERLASAFSGNPPEMIMTSGPLSAEIARAAQALAPQVQLEMVADLQDHASRLAGLLRGGDAVLIKGSRASSMERLEQAIRGANSFAKSAKTS